MSEMWMEIIEAFWIMGTLMLWVACVGLLVWVIGWGSRFRFWQTEEGLVIWSFSLALLLLVLNNSLGSIGASTRGWWEPAPNNFAWWYFTRLFINGFILWSIIRMLTILRRHWRNGESLKIELPTREQVERERERRARVRATARREE